MSHSVTITGATGHVGKQLAEKLLRMGIKVRAISRSDERLVQLVAEGAEAWVGDLQDTAFLTQAFQGVDAIFAMLPEHMDAKDFRADQRRTATSEVEAIKAAGVPRVVLLSSVAANQSAKIGPLAGLYEFESMLNALPGISLVTLRAAYLMENLLAAIPLIQYMGINGGVIRADLSHPMVATRDVANAAADYLIAPRFKGHIVRELLGPRDYTQSEATAILGAALGKPNLTYAQASYEDGRNSLLGAGFSESAADSLIEMFVAFNEGWLFERVHRNIANTTPTTLEEFACEVFVPAYNAFNTTKGA